MSLRTGVGFLESLRDGREIWLEGERVKDVTAHPRLRGAAMTIAELYTLQHQPRLQDRLSFGLDDGERIGYSHIRPRTHNDLRRRREMIKLWADENGGMLGRTPDFMNMIFAGYAPAHDYFAQGGGQLGDNIRRYHETLRRADLCLTHTLVHPQRDRATAAPVATEGENAARVVRETDAGAVIRGARMLATLAPLCDELAVVPSISRFPPDTEEAKPFAFAFGIAGDIKPILGHALPPSDSVGDRRLKPPLWLQTIIFVPLIFVVVWIGTELSTVVTLGWRARVPLILAAPGYRNGWGKPRGLNCFVASLSPMWILLQPRGYLGGFVLYTAVGRAAPALFELLPADREYPIARVCFTNEGLCALSPSNPRPPPASLTRAGEPTARGWRKCARTESWFCSSSAPSGSAR